MTDPEHDHIAVVGIGGRFPGAAGLPEFWANLLDGKDAVRFHTDDDLRAAGVPAGVLARPGYVRASIEAPDLEYFDAALFGFTPRDADILDPQIRMFLESAHSAIEHAGYDPHKIPETGVFGTVGMNRYLDMHVLRGYQPTSTTGLATGTLSYPDYTATHLAYRFGFRGPAMSVSAACSSSALAVHLACQSLLSGECDAAVAGGAELEVPVHHGYQWDSGGLLSPDGRCRPFDAEAAGTVFGSGAGAVLLKRYGDAVADHDTIWAVIRASAVNNDGAAKAGFSAPGLAGQIAVVTEALQLAGVGPGDLSYVEAHATGTVLGDPIEVAALTQAFTRLGLGADAGEPIVLSSIKGNVGHLGHASGVVSLIKTCLALRHEQLPATANFAQPNPRLQLDRTPFEVRAETTPWPRVPGRPRRAGLNSLGIGGTNVHLVIEEAPEPERRAADARPQLLVWSAGSEEGGGRLRAALADAAAGLDATGVHDLAATLQEGRTVHAERAAVVAAPGGAAAALRDAPAIRRTGGQPRDVAFLFPGQGAQHVGMARALHAARPDFAAHVDDCLDRFADLPGDLAVPDLREVWAAEDDGAGDRLADTRYAQPLLFSIGFGLARLWADLGVRPAAVLGHSLGELTAAAVAGVLDLDDAVTVVAARAAAMGSMPPGAMLSVRLPADELRPRLRDGVAVAVVNDPAATTLAGPSDAVLALAGELSAEGVAVRRLHTSHAFHCDLMAAAVDPFLTVLRGVKLREPRVRLISAAAGGPVTGEATDPRFWAEQLVRPVRFDRGLSALLDEAMLALELGPGRTLTALAQGTDQVRSGASAARPCLAPPVRNDDLDDETAFLEAAGAVWVEGHPLDWQRLRLGEPAHRIPVPGYPYERRRHWVDPHPPSDAGTAELTEPAELAGTTLMSHDAPAEQSVVPDAGDETAFGDPVWVRLPSLAPPPRRVRTALVLAPAEEGAARKVTLALQRGGCRVTLARPGDAPAADGTEWRWRPDDPDDLERLLTAGTAHGDGPDLVVHALALRPWPAPTLASIDEQLRESVQSVRTCAQVLARRRPGTELIVLTDGAADVSGAETPHPAKASLAALVRSLRDETGDVPCRLVDTTAAACDVAALAADLAAEPDDPVVALRGARRWARTEAAVTPGGPSASRGPAVREGGVYILTGGCGGLGLAVARALGETGAGPHLVLTTRRDPAALPASDLSAIRATGATVEVRRCDVTDLDGTRALFDAVRAERGAVHGVVHLAGLPGEMVLLRRSAEATAAVLAPKAHGTLVLAEVLAGQGAALDFVVGFSSRAALTGLVGGADYAAANAFMDAAFVGLARAGLPATTVNWPAWRDVGMASDPGPVTTPAPAPAGGGTAPDARRWETTVDVASWPILDEHRLSGTPILPATAHLDLVIRAFRESVAGEAGPVRLDEVVLHDVLDGSQTRRWSCEFAPRGDGWEFTARSHPQAESAHPSAMVHVTGRVRAAEAAPPPDGALARLAGEMTVPAAPEPDPDGFDLGPRWDVVESTTLRGDDDGERLLRLRLPEAFRGELAGHAVHPTLLDAATTEVRRPASDGLALPFRCGSLTVYEPLPARVVSHIRRRPSANGVIVADVDVYAEDGRRVAAIGGFTMRRVQGGALAPARRPQPPARTADGLDPRTGGELFLTLLSSPRLEQVAVRPYESGRPVALARSDGHTPLRPSAQAPVVPKPGADARPDTARPATPITPPTANVPAPENAAGPAPTRSAPTSGNPPGADTRDRLAALWRAVLGDTRTGGDGDFFKLGGNSLTAVELMNAINAEFGLELSVIALFDYPRLDDLAGFIESTAKEPA
ncbi:type I polyketide synthase [Actinomadura verrucosospora]|uniref:6-deoxyerythronolide-B synthase, Aspartate racemase n=1 Tax=Actinomadura verrucosospora TaxID=46165 RepID=A0A7D3VTK2_ACTVE|nr:type I polyketide synthase [Actinomadura verrucosospora]QKG18652.1 6-deoxyerythronolide-B synthase, Aspartate racemase [Actinomadura verrucosospora]